MTTRNTSPEMLPEESLEASLQATKQPWVAPEITSFEAIGELTQGGSNNLPDGTSNQS